MDESAVPVGGETAEANFPRIYAPVFGFLRAFCEGGATFVDSVADADFILAMCCFEHEAVLAARHAATAAGKPFCWWTIEDPNSYHPYLAQARLADLVFTSDRACIPFYQHDLRHNRVYWLPLAADPSYHRPLPLREDATDFVFSGNWYDARWEARRWAAQTVIVPLAEAGYSVTCFSLEPPPYPILLQEPNRWFGPTDPRSPGYYSAVAQQYTYGKVVLGVNNQRSGMDGRGLTEMCSMRVFEALACGKAFLSAQSDAYPALGLRSHNPDPETNHMIWCDGMAEYWGAWCLANVYHAQAMAENGRAFVLANHTYRHRMARMAAAVRGEADPRDWK